MFSLTQNSTNKKLYLPSHICSCQKRSACTCHRRCAAEPGAAAPGQHWDEGALADDGDGDDVHQHLWAVHHPMLMAQLQLPLH